MPAVMKLHVMLPAVFDSLTDSATMTNATSVEHEPKRKGAAGCTENKNPAIMLAGSNPMPNSVKEPQGRGL